MEKFGIPQPCKEDFSKMTVTERGAFCSKCSTDTFNFTNKSHVEIKSILRDNIGKEICGRILPGQIDAINADFEQWSFRSKRTFQSAFVFSLIAVFGLSLFSCQEQKHEAEITNFQKTTMEIAANIQNQISVEQGVGNAMQIVPNIELNNVPLTCGFPEYGFSYGMGGSISMPDFYSDFLYAQPTAAAEVIIDEPIMAVSGIVKETPVEIAAAPEVELIAFPNPTSGMATLEFKNLEKARYQIDLYDLNGKHYQDIYSGKIDEEMFRQPFDISELPPGMYLVTIVSKDFKQTLRISKI